MKWWNDLWLNEGFATFMQYKAVDYAEPSWNFPLRFIADDLVRALHADESHYTHQIAVPVKNPAEISSIFDDISYGKGSSILRMLEAWMDEKYGKQVFFEKLSGYLKSHAFGNAETKELWAALTPEPSQPLSVFMKTWTDQPGFPVLTFDSPGQKGFTVQQQRFLFAYLIGAPEVLSLDGKTKHYQSVESLEQVWSVPLSYAIYSNSTGSPKLLSRGFVEINKLGEVKVPFEKDMPADSILLANFKQTGVYRSLYDKSTYYSVIDWLEKDLEFLPAVERGGLISDVFSMTFSGLLDEPEIAFELLNLLQNEVDVDVWDTALKVFDQS